MCGFRYCLADKPNEFQLYVDSLKSRGGENPQKITVYSHLRQLFKTVILFPHNLGLFLAEIVKTALQTREPVGSMIFCDHTVIELDEVKKLGESVYNCLKNLYQVLEKK